MRAASKQRREVGPKAAAPKTGAGRSARESFPHDPRKANRKRKETSPLKEGERVRERQRERG